ncbi:MAG: hypothetical protein M3R04_08560, partial [bacterium]|nr:hypothetical protein [bacterium]
LSTSGTNHRQAEVRESSQDNDFEMKRDYSSAVKRPASFADHTPTYLDEDTLIKGRSFGAHHPKAEHYIVIPQSSQQGCLRA